jgi:glycosyltransferase 2 family protein
VDSEGTVLAVDTVDSVESLPFAPDVPGDPNLPETASEPGFFKRHSLALRIVASFAMLGLLYTRLPDLKWDEVVPSWSAATASWIVGAVALTIAAIVLSALRWKQVLNALDLGETAPMKRLVPLYFAGQFVSNVLPTTIGGDVLRVSRLSKDNGTTPDTFASVVLERLTGWLVLPIITFVGLIVNPDLLRQGTASTIAVLTAVGTLIALGGVLFIAYHPSVGGRFRSSTGAFGFIGAVHIGVDRLRRHPRAALGVLGVGLLYQCVLCLAALMAAAAVGIGDVGPTPLLAFFPAVLIAQVLPLGISGLGIREGAFVLFLTPLGFPAEQAIALGLLLYLVNLVASLVGAPAFAIHGRDGGRHEQRQDGPSADSARTVTV